MQRWLSLCHLGEMVGKLLSSILAAYVYHGKAVTYRFTLVICEEPPTHTDIFTNLSSSLYPQKSRKCCETVGFILRASSI